MYSTVTRFCRLSACFGHSRRSVSRDFTGAYGHKLDRAPHRPSVLDCNFTAITSTCNWANDHNNWPANWQVVTNAVGLSNAVCLDVRASPEAFSQSKELTARMFGPLVKSGIHLRCLRFYYMFQVPRGLLEQRHVGLVQLTPRLTLLRRQMGQPDDLRLLDCNFEDPDEEFCFWQGDPRNQGAKWKRDVIGSDQVACLKPFSLSSRYTSVRSHSLSPGSLNGRLWSENVVSLSLSAVDQKLDTLPKCLRFQYLIDLEPANQLVGVIHRPTYSLSLLRHSSGQLTRNGRQRSRLQSVDPVNCTYDNGDFCGWTDDPRDVLAWWEVVPMPTSHTQIACLVASTELGAQNADLLVKGEGSARLWSGQIRDKGTGNNFLQCIRFVYQISDVSLPGARSEIPQQWQYSTPPFACSFENQHMCGWMPDPRDGGAQWNVQSVRYKTTTDMAVCLTPSSVSSLESFGGEIDDNRSDNPALNGRLWSRTYRPKQQLYRCLSLAYYVSHGVLSSADLLSQWKLSILRHSSGSCESRNQNPDGTSVRVSCSSDVLWRTSPSEISDSPIWIATSIELPDSGADFKCMSYGYRHQDRITVSYLCKRTCMVYSCRNPSPHLDAMNVAITCSSAVLWRRSMPSSFGSGNFELGTSWESVLIDLHFRDSLDFKLMHSLETRCDRSDRDHM
ncbi:hypothetical protein EG68_11218 [Paragonimus skrjabini miyazakii]|uniref:MAM domain-containing protein n=1 Tax=Paragonimus skrjabini miyazakii TaxID=59628 RepID=A0A8S9YEF9_9TREM|nr:hypothetical protein EG68_11218 [Paragonimus skrjabini miyazakii]